MQPVQPGDSLLRTRAGTVWGLVYPTFRPGAGDIKHNTAAVVTSDSSTETTTAESSGEDKGPSVPDATRANWTRQHAT